MPKAGVIGRNVARLRKAQDLTQVDLSKRSGVSQAFISDLERGNRVDPKASILQALARALGVTVDELLREEEPTE